MSKQILLLALCAMCAAGVVAQDKPALAEAKPTPAYSKLRAPVLALTQQAMRELLEQKLTAQRLQTQVSFAIVLGPRDAAQSRRGFEQAALDWQSLAAIFAMPADEEAENNAYQWRELRNSIAREWAAYDGAAALGWLRASRPTLFPPPSNGAPPALSDEEKSLETEIAAQMVKQDPQAALKLARESLRENGFQANHNELLSKLREREPAAAQEFAHQIYEKITDETLLEQSKAYALTSFLQLAHASAAKPEQALLKPEEITALAERMIRIALEMPARQLTGPEDYARFSAVQVYLRSLAQWPELEKYVPGRAAQLKERQTEWEQIFRANNGNQQSYYETVLRKPLDEALTAIGNMPAAIRPAFYGMLAERAAREGRPEMTQQIANEYVTDPAQRAALLRQIETGTIDKAIEKENFDEARAKIARLPSRNERVGYLLQLSAQALEKDKKPLALKYLNEARQELGPRPAREEQLNNYFALTRAYASLAPEKAFEMSDALLDQFNALCVAAEQVDGFIGRTYQDGEFMLSGSLSGFASPLIETFAELSVVDLPRTSRTLNRLQRREVRIAAVLAIAQKVLTAEEDAGDAKTIEIRAVHTMRYGVIRD